MRASREEMRQHHEQIVQGAAHLFRERGVESTSIAEVMEKAGLTHGGFYRHFETKDALVAAAIEAAFAQLLALMDRKIHDGERESAVANFRSYYLSEGHLQHPATACPVATLSGEVARGGNQLRELFGKGVNQVLEILAECHTGKRKERRAKAARDFAMMVGAAAIARASDRETADAVLAACRAAR